MYLDRPDNLNAFTVEMAEELERTFVEVNDDDAVRAVIVTGSGRAFCAGMDLSSSGNVFGLGMSPVYEDLAEGRRSLAKLAGLDFEVAVFGHGKPIVGGAADRFRRKFGVPGSAAVPAA